MAYKLDLDQDIGNIFMWSEQLLINKYILMIPLIFGFIGCSDVKFQTIPDEQCIEINNSESGSKCIQQAGRLEYHFEFRVGRIDLLVINDNSGSMYTEQTQMADKFPSLFDKIKNLDYRIAMITTDVSASPGNAKLREANGNGEFQDGKFLKYSDGKNIITPFSQNPVGLFRNAIKRNETLNCDSSNYTVCPSGDERGIYALNLAIDRGSQDFFRVDSHLAVVILSDEDERSNGGNISGYGLEAYDLPKTLIQNIHSKFGPLKTVSFHPIIIQPGDQTCFNKQNDQLRVRGYFGDLYNSLAIADKNEELVGIHSGILRGHVGSICENDYSKQMGDIGSKASVNANVQVLPCVPAVEDISVSFSPVPDYQIEFSVSEDKVLTFSPQPKAGTTISVDLTCPSK